MPATPIELTTERTRDLIRHEIALRIRCRPVGRRRWSNYTLLPFRGETYEELEAKAEAAARELLEQEGAA